MAWGSRVSIRLILTVTTSQVSIGELVVRAFEFEKVILREA